ncbi:MAG: type II toxin-antitoxin system Phd/YefM family antitoxin [Actinobacteria bacterium]|nr:type II toxin-antitoxin system Phd/YefM family antitoxin [Actinomycetota bacterium]
MTKSTTKSYDVHVMTRVGVHEAKTHLSSLLRRVAAGEEIMIMRGAAPAARLVPVASRRPRQLGCARGEFTLPDDFNDPLPDEVLDDFER